MKLLSCAGTAVVAVLLGIGLVSCAASNERGGSLGTGGKTASGAGGGGSSQSSGGGSGGGQVQFFDGGFPGDDDGGGDPDANPCAGPNPPSDCHLVASGPACGDGIVNQPSEQCDDGNTLPGDGCNGICQIEPGFTCPPAGGPCTSNYVCGNGILDPGEVCDDGNTKSGDGCSSDCLTQEPGYLCTTPGQPCTKLWVCGDGRLDPGETCDDGNTTSNDGCSSTCQTEPGWVCLVPGQPCQPAARCGDGILQPSLGEVCDDGNDVDGDGCSADCKSIDAGWVCPVPGMPCVNTVKCGDGKIEGNEQCDDGNTKSGDGCSATCTLESGYTCPFPGSPCVVKCGDGIVAGAEQCDDGNTMNGDGCSSTCRWEAGWACTGPAGHYTCHHTTCGDGIKEGTEACDPGTGPGGIHDTGNGCSPFCTLEPNCTAKSGICTSTCGDGILLTSAGEQCDDGNTIDGDGCSSTCQIEPGYTCSQPPLGQSMSVPVVYRDFNARGDANGFVDFNPGATNQNAAITGLVGTKLDNLGKPVYVGVGGGTQAAGFISSAATYAQWFRDDPGGQGAVNRTIVDHITLWANGSGGYVNRWGANGEQWTVFNNSTLQWCSNTSNDCAACPVVAGGVCLPTCPPWNNGDTCIGIPTAYDGNPVFFPIDPVSYSATGPNQTANGSLLMSPVSPYQIATIAPAYGGNWNNEPGGAMHNFNFTTEIRYWFLYDSTQSYELDFTGDDDVWVFLNRTLAVDLGSIHTPQSGSVIISAATAGQFNLVSGNLYEIAVFQDERQTTSSTFKLTLSGFNEAPSVCTPVCGNGVTTPPEQCDDGAANAVGYGKCQPDCTWGPYCGDGIVNGPEQCDNGVNQTAYSLAKTSGCAPGCVLPPYCGDGMVQAQDGEQCDDGTNDGSYGTCTPTCQRAPFCGDGIVQAADGEQCDDGKNDGSYGTCAPGCKLGPRCGDGVVQSAFGETCDDGANNGTPGDMCSANCKPVGTCGDGIVEAPEQCDDGTNSGGYGKCAPGCKYGPRCGDGVVQKPYEQCDDGTNSGGYGQCAPGCVLGPYCGDGIIQPGYEDCDDGPKNGTLGDTCSSACKLEISVQN